ncbi:MAG: hypothetical protein ACLQVM_22445 [Terriglobia bacterium]
MGKRKLVTDYIIFVGVPLLALVGILRAGKHLTAPVAVHGTWSVQADFHPWQGVPCGALLINSQPLLLGIDQSGSNLTLTLNDPAKTALPATIDGFSLSTTFSAGRGGTAPAPRPDAGCLGSQPLRIQATVNQHEKQRSLAGTFNLDGCASCPPVAFSAARLMPTGRTQQ